MRLTTAGVALGLDQSIVGRITCEPVIGDQRDVHIFVSPLEAVNRFEELRGYRGTITSSPCALAERAYTESGTPLIYAVREYDHFRSGDLVLLQPATGFVRTVYRPDSEHNALFMTERCNSNCLMCSQPPKDRDDVDQFVRTNLDVIRLVRPGPQYIGITGGEPTLLGQGLMTIVAALRDQWPATDVHMLTNGRLFAWTGFTRRFAAVGHPRLTLGIPLYSDDPVQHDYIVQAKHAFDQTVIGLHALARWKQQIEIRIVLHRASVPRLPNLARYIYRNFPFVAHVALMGLEPTGYTPRNREKLWIDPFDYQNVLEEAVEILSVRGMNVSLYNLQLCLLRPSLWKFARKSISDWKNIYLPECEACGRFQDCGGLFKSSEKMHSSHIHSLPA
jgi:His-Xaa-Ser system radical SAM maturase HxsC